LLSSLKKILIIGAYYGTNTIGRKEGETRGEEIITGLLPLRLAMSGFIAINFKGGIK